MVNSEQKILLETYKDVADSLDRSGIRYYGFFGTAIGTVRHQGFIPWDDDLDIIVKEEDIEQVCRTLSEYLDSNKYYLHIPRADTHPHVLRRTENMKCDLRDKAVPFMDIFVLAKYPSTVLRRYMFDLFTWSELLCVHTINWFGGTISFRAFRRFIGVFASLRRFCVNKDSTLRVPIGHYFKRCIFDESCYGNPVVMDFEDTKIPLPSGYHEILSGVYGDYMTPPPEDKRSGACGYPCSIVNDFMLDSSN